MARPAAQGSQPAATERRAALAAAAGLVIALALVLRVLSATGWDPAAFVKVGEVPAEFAEYARAQLGDIPLDPGRGHDGKFYFVQALDPLLLGDPGRLAALLDEPAFRAQRMFYPFLSGGAGLVPPEATVWGMLLVNLAATALGCWATGRVGASLGLSPWTGLTFVLNPGTIFELLIDGAGLLAWALASTGLLALERGRRWPAVGLLAAAVLTRETMLLAAVGAAVLQWRLRRPVPWAAVAVPAGVALAWGAWVRLRLGAGPSASPTGLDLPFVGLVEVWPRWVPDELPGLVMGGALVALALYLLVRVARLRHVYLWGCAAFVLLVPLMDAGVWREPFDSSRALAPIVAGASLALLASLSSRRQSTS